MVSNVRLHNPDFEYLFFDNAAVEKFIDTEFPEYRALFDGFRYRIQKYDFFRYLAVYRYGGFYFDLDVLLEKGVSALLEYGCVFSFEGLTYSRHLREKHGLDWEIGNYAFGAAAGHPFLKAVIDNCVKAQKEPAWLAPMMQDLPLLSKQDFEVLYTTGPGLVTRTFAERPDLAQSVKVLFPDNVCDFKSWNHFGDYGVHLMDASWRFNKGRFRNRLALQLEGWKLQGWMRQSIALGKTRTHNYVSGGNAADTGVVSSRSSAPLVSILIPAYNAEEWIGQTLRSALAQTWENKEIIVVDDGSKDATYQIAKTFEKYGVRVVRQENSGAPGARNAAYSASRGDYIQWLDADDLLAPDKISKQMELVKSGVGKRTALSGPYGIFMYRVHRTRFEATDLWCDRMTPVEWLLRKMGQNLYMQTATWLISRELAEAAGPWDTRLLEDDDGEYFCRVLLASDGVQFVPDAKVYYRSFGFNSLSYLGESTGKLDAHWISMKLHIEYLRRMERSDRVNRACLQYLRNWLIWFYPERKEIVEEAQQIAQEIGEPLGVPSLSWKYFWIKNLFGWRLAKTAQRLLRKQRWIVEKRLDKFLYVFDQKPLI